MSNKRYKVKKSTSSTTKKKKTILNREELLKIYSEKIEKPLYDDLVLVVLGGEFGVITEFLKNKIPFSSLIIIEPNPQFFTNETILKSYTKLRENNTNIHYISVPEIEKNSTKLLNQLISSDLFVNGLEIINNPVYEELYPEKMQEEREKLDNYLRTLKYKKDGLKAKSIEIAQKNQKISRVELSEIFDFPSNQKVEDLFRQEKNDIGDGSFVVLIGGEYGYYTKYLLENNYIYNLIIVEPLELLENDNKAINLAKETEEIGLKSLKTFYFSKGHSEELAFFEFIKNKLTYIKNSKILINPLYEKKYINDIKETLSKVTKYMKNTAFLKGNSIADDLYGMTNSLYNLRKTENLKVLDKLPAVDTVISVAAGPSLDEHMDELKELSKKFPIVAVEVVVNKLLKNGIKPDIICAQERVYFVSQIVKSIPAEIRERTLFVAPTLIHSYNLDYMKKCLIISQPTKSPLEEYLSKSFYDFSPKFPQSLYAGEVNMHTATLFNPKQILLFGHDLAIHEEKKHASDVIAGKYNVFGSKEEIGNRGDKVTITPLFDKFRTNTETMLSKIKSKRDITFVTFSNGAEVRYIENGTKEDYLKFLKEAPNKPNIEKYIKDCSIQKSEILDKLNKEIELIDKQLTFLENIENLSRFSIAAKFTHYFIKTTAISSGVVRLIIDDFLSKHMYSQEKLEVWIQQNKDEMTNLYQRIKNVLENSKKLLLKEEPLPEENEELSKLFKFDLFDVIRSKALDSEKKVKIIGNSEELKYIILSYFYGYESADFLQLSKLLGQLNPYIYDDAQAKNIYYEGIDRMIEFCKQKWDFVKDEKNDNYYFFRYQLASYNYEKGNLDFVINFLSPHNDLKLPEKVVVADALSDKGNYEMAFKYYKEALKENQSARVIINGLYSLIMSDKIAESYLLIYIFGKSISNYDAYKANINLLEEKTSFLRKNKNYKLRQISSESSRNKKIISLNKSDMPENLCDELLSFFAAQNNIQIYKDSNQQRRYFYDSELTLDFSYFLLNL